MALRNWPSEKRTYNDATTGVPVHQLTNHLSHTYHLYFTNSGWWDGNRQLLFASDRGNAANLYSMDVASTAITQLTDNPPGDDQPDYQGITVNPARDEGYLWHNGVLTAIDLHTCKQRTLFTCEPGWTAHGSSATADGKYVVAAMSQKVNVGPVDLGAGYVGFGAIFEARPLHQIIRVSTAGENNPAEILHEERAWIGHVNPSPVLPDLITYCYEGPWTRVGQRIWGFDLNDRKPWKIRPQEPGEGMGHEYFMEDGITIGYHGKLADGSCVFGYRKYDNTDAVEVPFPMDSNHFHSNTPNLIVADGPAKGLTPYVLLCKSNGAGFSEPRVLCVHRGSRHTQHLHIHPRFTPDGKQVLYTSDPRGYGQLFLADVPDFESLPTHEAVLAAKRK